MDMMELPPEIGKFLIGRIKEIMQSENEAKWPAVGTLRPEDITRKRNFDFEDSAIKGKMKVLMKKLEALEAERDVKHSEYWEHLYSTYNLPRNGRYAITKDHVIKKKPSKGPACACGKCPEDNES